MQPSGVQAKDKQQAMDNGEEAKKPDAPPLPKKKHHEKKSLHLSRLPPSNPSSDPPVVANFDSRHLTIGAGVAIFHLATSRVVLCQHSVKKYWFLPKGRRDVGEDTVCGAEREGFEEVNLIWKAASCACRADRTHSPDTATVSFLSQYLTASPIHTMPLPVLRLLCASPYGPSWPPFPALPSTCSSGILRKPFLQK